MAAEFTLHPQLAKDCFVVDENSLCLTLLMNDSRFPWLILVPRVAGAREVYELDQQSQLAVYQQSQQLYQALQSLYRPDKINIASIGNMVPQLHIHHIARFSNDAVWPRPVWGHGLAEPYSAEAAQKRIGELQVTLVNKITV